MRAAGIYANVDIDIYHFEEGISSTGINLILDCPKRFAYEKFEKPKNKESEAEHFKLGRALHMLVLEPHKFDNCFHQMTEKVKLNTTKGKEAYAQAEVEADGRQILRAGEIEDIYGMAKAMKDHKLWQHIKDGEMEQSIYWEGGGMYATRLRARPDVFTSEIIVDIKSCRSINEFKRSIYGRGYHRQAAMQIDGLNYIDGIKRHFAFFVVESTAPYLTACFTLDEVSTEQGRKEYKQGSDTYTECLRLNNWPGYDTNFQLASIPKWSMPTCENDDILI
jgi:exodeoxyribonuclease VIII